MLGRPGEVVTFIVLKLWVRPTFKNYSNIEVVRQWHPTLVLLPGKSMGGGAWWAAVHGVAKSWTRLSDFTFTFHFHALEKEMATTPVFLPGESQGRGSLVAAVYGVAQSRT